MRSRCRRRARQRRQVSGEQDSGGKGEAGEAKLLNVVHVPTNRGLGTLALLLYQLLESR